MGLSNSMSGSVLIGVFPINASSGFEERTLLLQLDFSSLQTYEYYKILYVKIHTYAIHTL